MKGAIFGYAIALTVTNYALSFGSLSALIGGIIGGSSGFLGSSPFVVEKLDDRF